MIEAKDEWRLIRFQKDAAAQAPDGEISEEAFQHIAGFPISGLAPIFQAAARDRYESCCDSVLDISSQLRLLHVPVSAGLPLYTYARPVERIVFQVQEAVAMRGMFPMAVALAAVAAFAQDVVQLAPDQVKVVFENDHVRVLRFNEPGHSKLPMHSHPAYVTVGLTTDHSKYTFPDGKTSDTRTKADDVTYSKGITHAYENLSDAASESIMVELKKPGAAAAAGTTLDPVKLDPKHYEVVIDNDQVRVLRAKYGPHEKSVMHEHPASVVVYMSDGHVKFTLPDGTSQDTNSKAHDATWAEAGKHLPENVGDKPTEVIVIELK